MMTFLLSKPKREFTCFEDSRATIRRSSVLRIRSGTNRRLYSSPSNTCSKCINALNSFKYLNTKDNKKINIKTEVSQCFSPKALSKTIVRRFEEKFDKFCVCGSILETRKLLTDHSTNLKIIEDSLTDCTNYLKLQTKTYHSNEKNRVYHVRNASDRTKFEDISQTASELSCFESSNSVKDINCNFCAVSNEDEFSSAPKDRKTTWNVTEKTRNKVARKRARTMHDSPKKSSRRFCNSSSDKLNVNISKINKMNEKENTVSQLSQRKLVVSLEEFSFDNFIGTKRIKSNRKKSSFKPVNADSNLNNTVNNLKIKYKDLIKNVSVSVTPLSVNKKQSRSKTPLCCTGNRFTNNISLKKIVDDVAVNKNIMNAPRLSKVLKVSKKNLESEVSVKKKKTIKNAKDKSIRNNIRKKSPETKMLSSSPKELNVTFSSKGRARLPRLEYWRGERMSTVEDFTIYESEVLAKPQKIGNINCSVVLERRVDGLKNSVAPKNRISKVNFDSENINGKLSVSKGKRNVDLESVICKSRYKKQKKENNKSNCKSSSKGLLSECPRLSQRDSSLPTKRRKLFSQSDFDIDGNDDSDSAALHSCLTEISESHIGTVDTNETSSVRMNTVPANSEKLKENWINEILQKIGPSNPIRQEDVSRKSQTFSDNVSSFDDRTSLWVESNFSKTSADKNKARPPTFSTSVGESFNKCRRRLSTVNEKDDCFDECPMEIDKSYGSRPSGDIQQVDDRRTSVEKTASLNGSQCIILNIDSSGSESCSNKETTNVSSDEVRSYVVSSIKGNDQHGGCSDSDFDSVFK